MKTKILSRFVAIVFLTGLFGMSCNDADPKYKTGTAIGYDISMCACCGGLFVEYLNDTLLFPDTPQDIIDWETMYGFPLVISFNYEDIQGACFPYQKRMTYVELLAHP